MGGGVFTKSLAISRIIKPTVEIFPSKIVKKGKSISANVRNFGMQHCFFCDPLVPSGAFIIIVVILANIVHCIVLQLAAGIRIPSLIPPARENIYAFFCNN